MSIDVTTLAVGVLALCALLTFLVWRASTLYFGLTVLCFFMVSSASLAGFVHSAIFGLGIDWVTPAHFEVLCYSLLGCFAMAAGVTLAWRPKESMQTIRTAVNPLKNVTWINNTFGWVVFSAGTAAVLAESVFRRVPTVSTAINSLASFQTFGMLVLLADSVKRRTYKQLVYSAAIYVPTVMLQSFASGHTPAKVALLVPAICVVVGIQRVGARAVVVVGVCGFVLLSVMVGWLNARKTIRTGQLTGLGFVEKVQVFVPQWYAASVEGMTDFRTANDAIRTRLDMTDYLAMQVRHQPEREPFARGQTVIDAGVALVPRVLWPGKPIIAGGSAFVSKYTGMRRDPRDSTSLGLPYQFELYANGGAIYVVVGLFIIGYLCGILERGLFAPSPSLPSLLSRISMTMTLCDGGQRTDVVLPALIAGGITYYFFGKLIEAAAPSLGKRMLAKAPPRRRALERVALPTPRAS